jgi:hypothetical protein
MGSREFTEWLAYNQLEPFGHPRLEYGHALVAATIANVNRDPKVRREPFEVDDFLPTFNRFDSEQREINRREKLSQKLMNMFRTLGGRDSS